MITFAQLWYCNGVHLILLRDESDVTRGPDVLY